jgi:hypothetical protein
MAVNLPMVVVVVQLLMMSLVVLQLLMSQVVLLLVSRVSSGIQNVMDLL